MTFLISKLAKTILEILIELFTNMLQIFIEKPALFDETKFGPIMEVIQIISAVLLILSVMKNIILRLSGLEGNIYDINIGEYSLKIMFNIIALTLFPKILLVLLSMSSDIYGTISESSLQIFSSSNFAMYQNINIDQFGITVIIVLIVLLFQGITCLVFLAKTQVEVLLATLVFPIVLIDLYKGSDKLNSFLSKLTGLFVNMCLQIFLIYFALSNIINIPFEFSSDFAWSVFIAIACFKVASNPSVISDFIVSPSSGSGIQGALQKGYYASRIATASKKLFKKGEGQ